MNNYLEIRFGALQEKIAIQLKRQNLNFEPDKIKSYQELSYSISMLYIHGILIESERDKAYKRLYDKIARHIKKLNKK